MARVDIPVQTIPYQGSIDDITWTAGDATNDHQFTNDGDTVILMKNGDVSLKTATIVSVADPFGRTQDKDLAVPATSEGIAGPFLPSIWNQAGGICHLDLDADTAVELAAVKFTKRA